MGKEVKIGLAVIGLLLCVFGGVLFMRLRREQPATAQEKVAAAKKEEKLKSAKKPDTKPTQAKEDRYGRRPNATMRDDNSQTAAAEVNRFDAPSLATSPYRNRPAVDRYGRYDGANAEERDEPSEPIAEDANAEEAEVAMPEDRFAPRQGGVAFAGDDDSNAADPSADGDDGSGAPGLTIDPSTDPFSMRTAAVETDLDEPAGAEEPNNTTVELAPLVDDDSELRPAATDHYAVQQVDGDTYTVEADDTFWRISQKVYGTGAYFKALEEHNRQQYGARLINVGDVVSVPPLAELRRNYPDLAPKPRTTAPNRRSAAALTSPARGSRGTRTYTVVEGDTLFDIARHEMGKASRWAEIYQLNREQLGEDFNELPPGMQLVLPAADKVGPVSSRPAPRDNYRR